MTRTLLVALVLSGASTPVLAQLQEMRQTIFGMD